MASAGHFYVEVAGAGHWASLFPRQSRPPPHRGLSTLGRETALNGYNPCNPVRSVAQAILNSFDALDQGSPLRSSISGLLDPVGDQDDASPLDLLIGVSAQTTSENAAVIALALSKIETVADAAGEVWQFLLETEVRQLPVRTVVGYEVLRLMLHTEMVLLRMPDAYQRIEHDLRIVAADQAATWLFG